MSSATFRIWRGGNGDGAFVDYNTEVETGMVVLDAVHKIQGSVATDMAVRWNCKAGKCGSCSAEINGKPRLMCMTRLNQLDLTQPVTIEPMKTFPHVKDLVTDVSWNYEVKKKIQKFTPRKPDFPDGSWKVAQADIDRPQEFRKCIECFLCQNVCHVLRDHNLHDEFIGPRFLIYTAQLEMNPIDTGDRLLALKDDYNIGYCNITKCCTKVCPEEIKITDNAIIPLKERVVDEFYDPLGKLFKISDSESSYSETMNAAAAIVVRSADVMGGTPVFSGTRVPFQTFMEYLEAGESLDTFLDHFPSVSREQAVGALEFAKSLVLASTE